MQPRCGAGPAGRRHAQTITIGKVPRLDTLYQGPAKQGTLLRHASPGVAAYDFTFG